MYPFRRFNSVFDPPDPNDDSSENEDEQGDESSEQEDDSQSPSPTGSLAVNSRLNSIFNSPTPSPDSNSPFANGISQQNPTLSTPDSNLMDVYKDLVMRRNGPSMQAYRQFLEKGYPNEKDYQPGKVTRLGAILSGAAAGFRDPAQGAQVAQSILDDPYNKALARYQSEGGRLKEAAALEEQEGVHDVQAMKSINDMSYKNQQLDRENRLADNLINTRNINAAAAAKRADAAGSHFEIDKTDGTGYVVKLDGSKVPVGKFDLATGEKLQNQKDLSTFKSGQQLNNEKVMEGIKFGNQEKRDNDLADIWKDKESTRQGNRIDLIHEKADTAASSAANSLGIKNVDSIRQIKLNLNDVQALIDKDPDRYSQFFDPSTGKLKNQDMSNPDYQTIYRAMYKKVKTGATNNNPVKRNNAITTGKGNTAVPVGKQDDNEDNE